jgi:carbon monoxide dehydrogenase subunit G
MAWFTAQHTTSGVVPSPRAAVWSVLTDPDLVARLTPFVHAITSDGDLWRWEMTSLPVLGTSITPAFTERMTFRDLERIDFTHDPVHGADERTGVEGSYTLSDTDDGTHLAIVLEVRTQLPMPRAAAPAVRAAMRTVMGTMGVGFEHGFRRHLATTH